MLVAWGRCAKAVTPPTVNNTVVKNRDTWIILSCACTSATGSVSLMRQQSTTCRSKWQATSVTQQSTLQAMRGACLSVSKARRAQGVEQAEQQAESVWDKHIRV